MLPFDGSAPTIDAGTDYWITVKMPLGIEYPGGVHNTGFTAGHSFYESNTDTTVWLPLVITTERAWIMRAIGIPVGVSTSVAAGWNMVSNPVTTAADSMLQLFPTSLFPYGFGFSGTAGYLQQFRLVNGDGYWGKFPGAAVVTFSGGTRALDTIPVVAGWNMIGSISSAVDTSTIVSIPPGLRASSAWFGYNGGYTAAPTIDPGKAYWVKANSAGSFVFTAGPAPERAGTSAGNLTASMNSLTIRDAAGHVQTLYFGEGDASVQYEMPPLPPEGAFDARFETAEGGAFLKAHEAGAGLSIALRSAVGPVTVAWSIGRGEYALEAGDAQRTMSGQGSVTLPPAVTRMTLRSAGSGAVPAEYALMQNYPNPFNPSTTMRFALPVDSRVSLQVVNALGQKVADLVTGDVAAGYHTIEWNGTVAGGRPAASGVYFARFSATGVDGRSFADVRKLMLLK
jgi:hypothetical protein